MLACQREVLLQHQDLHINLYESCAGLQREVLLQHEDLALEVIPEALLLVQSLLERVQLGLSRYMVMAYIAVAYVVPVYLVMAYIVMAGGYYYSPSGARPAPSVPVYSYGLCSSGPPPGLAGTETPSSNITVA